MKVNKYIPFIFLCMIFGIMFFLPNNIFEETFNYTEDNYIISSLVYILVLIISTVIAPISTPVFLMGGAMFGPIIASIYNILGWTIGAVISFQIARYIARPVLSKFLSLEKIEEYERLLPRNIKFWSIVLLRVVTPVDVLSYALGFLSNVSFTRYLLATVIGIIPFSIVFAYGGNMLLSDKYVTMTSIIVIASIFFAINIYMHKSRES